MKFFFDSLNAEGALFAKKKFVKIYGQEKVENADIIVPIGGDGFLLKSLHDYKDLNKPFYGINFGTIGFLMNSESDESLEKIISKAQNIELKPLNMKAKSYTGDLFESIAFNEVSLMRQTHQAAKISININNVERMKELICDGILVSTSAGSTAYNLSAHGSILPLNSNLLALTPISAFRPRRWRGALLPDKTKFNFFVNNSKIRSTSVTADHNEFRDIEEVEVTSSTEIKCNLLFDNNHSMDERILKEQFYS
tara:strand:+ start:1302 stop:2060 length:759 start_codon:yes stop_codon:yes gene_type:complete